MNCIPGLAFAVFTTFICSHALADAQQNLTARKNGALLVGLCEADGNVLSAAQTHRIDRRNQ